MFKKVTRTKFQKVLLAFTLVFSIILQFPQPELDIEYYTSLASDYTESTDKDAPLQGLNVVITGATSGLGLDLSKQLYSLGGNIIAVGRSESKLAKLVEEVQAQQKGGSIDDKRIITVLADLQDMESVSAAANEIKSKFKTVDYLINNAGMTNQSHGKDAGTPQGYDMVFAVNYLSHFLLTEKLLPNLKLSKLKSGSRIVQISSSMHNIVSGDDLIPSMSGEAPVASLPSDESTHAFKSYGNSKLAQIYHARSLMRKYGDINEVDESSSLKVVSVCPAWVATHIGGAGFKSVLDVFAFQSNGFGLAPILFAMFHVDAGVKDGIYNDYSTNCSILSGNFISVMEQILKLTAPVPLLREAVLSIGSVGILLFQKMFASVAFRPTGSVGYDVVKQDALYKWSKEVVQPWV